MVKRSATIGWWALLSFLVAGCQIFENLDESYPFVGDDAGKFDVGVDADTTQDGQIEDGGSDGGDAGDAGNDGGLPDAARPDADAADASDMGSPNEGTLLFTANDNVQDIALAFDENGPTVVVLLPEAIEFHGANRETVTAMSAPFVTVAARSLAGAIHYAVTSDNSSSGLTVGVLGGSPVEISTPDSRFGEPFITGRADAFGDSVPSQTVYSEVGGGGPQLVGSFQEMGTSIGDQILITADGLEPAPADLFVRGDQGRWVIFPGPDGSTGRRYSLWDAYQPTYDRSPRNDDGAERPRTFMAMSDPVQQMRLCRRTATDWIAFRYPMALDAPLVIGAVELTESDSVLGDPREGHRVVISATSVFADMECAGHPDGTAMVYADQSAITLLFIPTPSGQVTDTMILVNPDDRIVDVEVAVRTNDIAVAWLLRRNDGGAVVSWTTVAIP